LTSFDATLTPEELPALAAGLPHLRRLTLDYLPQVAPVLQSPLGSRLESLAVKAQRERVQAELGAWHAAAGQARALGTFEVSAGWDDTCFSPRRPRAGRPH